MFFTLENISKEVMYQTICVNYSMRLKFKLEPESEPEPEPEPGQSDGFGSGFIQIPRLRLRNSG